MAEDVAEATESLTKEAGLLDRLDYELMAESG
jgi:hypothetical protein